MSARRIRRALASCAVVVTALAAGACGDPPAPAIGFRAEPGRELVYDTHRTDSWPDPLFGYGGTLETAARFRLAAIEDAGERGGIYRVAVESLRVQAPPRFGVVCDTATPEDEPGDTFGAEAFARSVLPRSGTLAMKPMGVVERITPDEELRTLLKDWGKGKQRPAVEPAMMVLDELLDAPHFASTWISSAAVLLPPGGVLPESGRWSRALPVNAPPGRLECTLEIEGARDAAGIVTLRGTGPFRLTAANPQAPLEFVSGDVAISVVFDAARGVLVSCDDTTRVVFRPKGGGAESRQDWHRELRLVE